MRAKVRIAREVLERDLWPDKRCKLRIVGATYDPKISSVILEVEGEGLPEGRYLRLMSRTFTETEFKPL
ncbi:hypothetical protein [Mesorhizobium sp. M0058]|uniref:hypothetical protein n=1 Tax=Mesorhizobium sp. M0058 TaxID=2956865 RepID=UPI00333D5D7B